MSPGGADPLAPEAGVCLGGDRPLLLGPADAWRVEVGQVNVFTVGLRDGAPVGPRTFLLQVPAGEGVFGADGAADGRRGLLAVGTRDTRIRRIATDVPPPPRLVDAWIDSVYAALTRDQLTAISAELVPGGTVPLAAGAVVRAGHDVLWVGHLSGRSRLLGRAGLEVEGSGLVPVSSRAWLEVVEDTRLVGIETTRLPSAEELWAGLARLARLVLAHADLAAAAEDAATRERMRRRFAHRDATLRNACARLAETMTAGGRAARPALAPADPEDPLLAACALVGEALGIRVKAPVRVGSAPGARLAAILRASGVRSRRVALREGWWRADNGPLVATLSADERPVALLRERRHYVLHDPTSGSERPVDARVAEELAPFAETLYRPFRDGRLTARDVARFALFGCRRDLLVVGGIAVVASLLGMVPALATGMLFNSVIPGAERSQLLQLTLVLLATAVASALFGLSQAIALLRLESRAGTALQWAVWDRLLALPLAFFRPYTSGDLAVRAMSIDAIRQLVSGATVNALLGGVLALGNLALMFWYSRRMAWWGLLVIGLVTVATLAGSYLQLRPQREATKVQSKVAGVVLQLLSGIAKLRVAGAEVMAFALWVGRFSEQRRLQYRARWMSNWVAAFNAAVPIASSLLIFSIATPSLTGDHTLRTGDFLAFLAAFTSAMTSLLATSLALLATLNTIPLYEQAKPILEASPESAEGKADPGVLKGDIEAQHLTFRYQHDGPLVLKDVSFRIRSGEFVAFVGPSGSGKSTLMRLLLGFDSAEGGAIYFDTQEVGGLDIQALRRQVGVVLQSGRLMSGDLYTNIIGSASATLEEAWEAARMAGLAEDIEAMPMGMHTVVSEGGGTLSGGQRQRLLIARAIVHRPRILLFDEATSALDNRTQAVVSSSLARLQATRIVVAHRLSTIAGADRIFVLQRGRIVQTGRYAELLAQEGPFAELARRQIA
jgi:NHLM bacteriocin system ABC transporter ATP-binding protein